MASLPKEIIVDGLPGGVVTVGVKLSHILKFRIWLALKLFQLGAWLINSTLDIEDGDAGQD